MAVKRDFGKNINRKDPAYREHLIEYINIKLATLGLPIYEKFQTQGVEVARDLIANIQEKNRLLADYLTPADQRIQDWLDRYLADQGRHNIPRIPSTTLVLDRYGMARELSLPPDAVKNISPTLTTYRIKNGILHNPLNDRRTTKGVFHVAEGGLPVPEDKKAVPKAVFAKLLEAAVNPPGDLTILPFTQTQEKKAQTFVSLLLRPIVSPEVPGVSPQKCMEIRFFAPGSLVSNLDFVESIFGNSGDPIIPENDAALDPLHWTGHTGCIILATHLTTLKKKDLGLPKWEDATDRQRRDGMCWKNPEENYNDGGAFKITARDENGVMVTLIADNYYGYSKKEVKTQISFSSNLLGLTEEEHAGGALAFPQYNHGMIFTPDSNLRSTGHTFADVVKLLGDTIEVKPEGYAVDKTHPHLVYLPEDAEIDLSKQTARWTKGGKEQTLRVLPEEIYIHPTGYKVHMEQHPASGAWRLVGTVAEGTLCHKPCTVSGGGKSEISKSLWDAMSFSPYFINDYEKDMDFVQNIIDRNYSGRFKVPQPGKGPNQTSRSLMSEHRSLGSVVKLLTPNPEFTDEYNAWLATIPARIKALVFLVKRFTLNEKDKDWRKHFTVDIVNGTSGHLLKFKDKPLFGSYLRIGQNEKGGWWTYKLRQDFMPADKVQWEDDISASIVLPADQLEGLNKAYTNPSVKLTVNVENRFFQRPDDAIHRGYDKQAEEDMAREDNFISNFEPLTRDQAKTLVQQSVTFSEYTGPMQDLIRSAAQDEKTEYFVASSHPRIVDGAPSKNPRYLQLDPNHTNPLKMYLADLGSRLYRKIPAGKPVYHPVNAVLPGRRNNPADHKAKIRPLAVYNPIHYQELPELFMDFIPSLTGKSPSTTGAGTEGALTKGPFNALVPTADLNNSLLAFILCGYNGFSSAAGYIGHKYRVDHDISLLMPELWARMTEEEKDPKNLLAIGAMEKLEDFEYQGKTIPASRLGYRITDIFAARYMGRIFDNPEIVFNQEMLKPELQSLEDYVDGILNITETQKKAAQEYFDDGSVESAIPPLKAVLHIMVHGHYEGKTLADPEVRRLFDRETVLASSWYKARLDRYAAQQAAYLDRSVSYIENFLQKPRHLGEAKRLGLDARLKELKEKRKAVDSPDFRKSLVGTIGADVLFQGK